jgi:hypothetical protein
MTGFFEAELLTTPADSPKPAKLTFIALPSVASNAPPTVCCERVLLRCSHEWTPAGGAGTGTVSAGFFLNSAKPCTKT